MSNTAVNDVYTPAPLCCWQENIFLVAELFLFWLSVSCLDGCLANVKRGRGGGGLLSRWSTAFLWCQMRHCEVCC